MLLRARYRFRPLTGALLLTVLGHSAAVGSTPPGRDTTVHGVTISTHTDGGDWSSPAMRSTMEDIQALGADWVCIHPYAMIRGDGTVRFHHFDPAEPPAYISHPIDEAHALGLKILIKPHLGYWGSPFSWRGDIAFDDEATWKRFFNSYEQWIRLLAAASSEADGFVVGTELDSTLSHEAEWRRVIAEVRKTTRAPLTYAANWSHYRKVAFWDALDVIGIQAYFPLTDKPDPEPAAIDAGWRSVMGELRAFAQEQNRDIVFTELGYPRSPSAPVRPWAHHSGSPESEQMQARCLQAALEAVENEPSVVGVFLWKWFPNPHPVGRDFQLATPVLKRVITEAWRNTR